MTGVSPQTKPILIFDFTKNPRPREYNPDISPEMEAALIRSVSYDARNRFYSAYALKRELESILQTRHAGADDKDLLTLLAEKKRRSERKTKVVPIIDETKAEVSSDLESLRKEFEEEFKDFLPISDDVIRTASAASIDIYCVKCFASLSENDLVCHKCGTEQPHSPFIKVPKAILKLEQQHQAFNVIKDITIIGRRDPERRCYPEIDLTPFDSGKHISRLHARILKLNGEYYIEDLKSKNKVVINGRYLLQSGITHKLNSGDTVKIGRLVFRFEKE